MIEGNNDETKGFGDYEGNSAKRLLKRKDISNTQRAARKTKCMQEKPLNILLKYPLAKEGYAQKQLLQVSGIASNI